MGKERRVGTLERIDLTRGRAHAFVRVGGELLHVCMVSRGVLQADGSICICQGDDRYQPISAPGNPIVELDIDFDSAGHKPHVVAWAPKSA